MGRSFSNVPPDSMVYGLNSGPSACQVRTLPTELHAQLTEGISVNVTFSFDMKEERPSMQSVGRAPQEETAVTQAPREKSSLSNEGNQGWRGQESEGRRAEEGKGEDGEKERDQHMSERR